MVQRPTKSLGDGAVSCSPEWANSHLSRWLYIAEPQPQSHIWNESSLIHYLQFLAGEIRARRAQLGLTASDRALVLMDQAGAHMSKTVKFFWKKIKTYPEPQNNYSC